MNLDRQSILLREKIDHYKNNFIETYEEELKECEENFENYYKNALQIFEKNFDMWVIELKDLIKKVEDGLIKIDEREESYSKYPKEKSINLGLINEERLKLRNRQKGIIGMLNASEHTKQIRYEKIKYLIDDFDKETEENRNHIELKNNLYKDLKNLVNLPNIE
jgi:esterase/lipase